MSETPETDAIAIEDLIVRESRLLGADRYAALKEHARQLERQRDEAVRIMREFVEHYEGPREQCLKGVSLTHFQNARQFLATLNRTEKT
jgi:hypothetical protein